MGRSIVYDPSVKEEVDSILQLNENHVGLIIGQRTLQKDTVVYLCPAPIQDDEEVDEKEENTSEKLDSLNEAWIRQHAKEVTRMLPGGIDVLGLYVASSREVAEKFKSDIQEALYIMLLSLTQDRGWSVHPDVTEGILLHICTTSKKLTCQTFDVADPRSLPTQAEWKPLSSSPKWHMLISEMAGDLKFPISKEKCNISVKKQLLLGLTPMFQRISASVAVIDGVLRDPSENLVQTEGKKSKHKTQPELTHVVDLLSPLKSKNCPVRSQASECILMFDCKGTIHLRAFIHGKATVEEAMKAVFQDIVRSITARCEIHCEDLLLIDEEQQDPIVVYELPRRVFAPLGKTGLLVCDYQFHGDTASDSLSAFSELLNLEVAENEVQIYETTPTTSSLIQPCNRDEGDHLEINPNHIIFPAAGAAFFAIVFGMVYIYIFRHW